MRLRSLIAGLAVVGLAAIPSAALAAPLQGSLSIANDGSGGVRITNNTIDWFLPRQPVGTTGSFQVGAPATLDFAFLLNDTGTIKDLHTAVQPVGAPFVLGAPPAGFNANSNLVGEGIVLADFLRFDTGAPFGAAAGDIAFDLAFIFQGAFPSTQCFLPAAAGQVCSLPGTPFNFINSTATTSSSTSAVSGFVRRISTGELSAFSGVFSTQFTTSFQDVLASLTNFGYIENTYSSTFTATINAIPEPATLVLLGSGLVGAAMRRRRAKK